MKLYELPDRPKTLVRVSFGNHDSIVLEDTTTSDVFAFFIDIMKSWNVEKIVKIKGSPLDTPQKDISLVCTIREEYIGRNNKGISKSKTLYGVKATEAKEYFISKLKKLQ